MINLSLHRLNSVAVILLIFLMVLCSCKKSKKTICENMADNSVEYDIVREGRNSANYVLIGIGTTKDGVNIWLDEEFTEWMEENLGQNRRDIHFYSEFEVGGSLGGNIRGNWSTTHNIPFSLRMTIMQTTYIGLSHEIHKLNAAFNKCRCYLSRGEFGEFFKGDKIYIYFPQDKDGHNILILERYS
jgi:hypothetical protein